MFYLHGKMEEFATFWMNKISLKISEKFRTRKRDWNSSSIYAQFTLSSTIDTRRFGVQGNAQAIKGSACKTVSFPFCFQIQHNSHRLRRRQLQPLCAAALLHRRPRLRHAEEPGWIFREADRESAAVRRVLRLEEMLRSRRGHSTGGVQSVRVSP